MAINAPHEAPFQYDEALLSSCASSYLVVRLLSIQDGVSGEGEYGSSSSAGLQKWTKPQPLRHHHEQQQHQHQNTMGDAASDDGAGDGVFGGISSNKDCRAIFEAHAAYYQRPPLTVEEYQFWTDSLKADLSTRIHDDDILQKMSPRVKAFLQSVIFVHQHNNSHTMGGKQKQHRVTLNRFSDVLSHELPLMSHATGSDDTNDATSAFFGGNADDNGAADIFEPLEAALHDLIPIHATEEYLNVALQSLNLGRRRSSKKEGGHDDDKNKKPMFVPLEDDETIFKFGEQIRQRKERGKFHSLEEKNDNLLSSLTTPSDSTVGTSTMGTSSWWWIGEQHTTTSTTTTTSNTVSRHSSTRHKDKKPDSFLLNPNNEREGLEEKGNDINNNDWDHSLNWATANNPDGVSVVHDSVDQGLCGSCWAVSALGTLEASIARNMAYSAYEEAFSSSSSSTLPRSSGGSSSSGSSRRRTIHVETSVNPRELAVLAAQHVERRSIDIADLSVQELVDCDNRYDQGCLGGNPLLVFYFLHRFGVTSSENYPYVGRTNTCNYDKVDEHIASVETWGILTPDHENNMEKVLRFIGPVAVGMIGADAGFLSYAGGVFTNIKGGRCDVGQADHALLITGYGEETSKDGTVKKYWIARNSWGSGWGENGYVRIARLGGKKGHRGVCGIARSPSVALGGMFTKDFNLEMKDLYGSTLDGEEQVNGEGIRGGTTGRDDSTSARASSEIRSVIHRIRTRLGFLQKDIVMSINDGSEHRKTGITIPNAMAVCMLAFGLLLMYRNGRRRCRQDGIQQQQSNEEESVATNWSTAGVYHGVHVSSDHGTGSRVSLNDGERIHLLSGSSGSLYT
eukprot:CAMPEP_0201626550 /NCGR_PEP_ID=MMETSP0493-20130528/1883_1 /ASSEMBLY_ACC=CAM_ASM_000838 /TAXON_ID=420259 /ORGANISM="Thalassiosira gravida, Strain GMp14c1" /LENGTH=849 /DNA_ID=CAMNT_0048096651 /DNA_START=22 /DNA_END=2571 /DNA_ORIENTATION=-